MAGQNQIASLNMTNFFNRELMMYSFGDIRFKKPISLKAVAYTLALLILWTLPLILVFGIPTDPFGLIVYVLPPIVLGQIAIRPLFGGKTLLDFLKTAFKFLGEPRGWADGEPFDAKNQVYTTEHEIWISRRREYAMLADMIEAEQAALNPGKTKKGAKPAKSPKVKSPKPSKSKKK